jgi:hypothetical protein
MAWGTYLWQYRGYSRSWMKRHADTAFVAETLVPSCFKAA